MKRLCYVLILVLVVASSAQGKNLYVTPSTGSDATTYANNDADNPWATLLRAEGELRTVTRNSASVAAQAAQAGDVVYVTEDVNYTGTSYDQGSFGAPPFYDPVNSGSSWSNPITFEAVGNVELSGNTSGSAAMLGSFTGTYIIWRGFTIDQANIGYRSGNGINSVWVDNIWFDRCVIIGEDLSGEDNNHSGILWHGERTGTYCTDALVGLKATNNKISGVTGLGTSSAGMTIYCVHDITIEHNELYENVTGLNFKSSYTDSAYTSYVRYNLIHDNEESGVRFQAWSDFEVYQNVIRDNTHGITLHASEQGVGNDKPNDIYIANNTFDNHVWGIYLKGVCADFNSNYYRNNINTNTTYALYSEDCTSANIQPADIDFDYNVYDDYGSFSALSGGGLTFSGWQSAYSQDSNSGDNIDPLFTNEAGNEFTLQAGSPCREGQANEGVDILDLDGDSSTVDAITIGAYITGNEEIGVEPEDAQTFVGCTITGGVNVQ